jgi:hypothetical protein
MPLLAFIWCLNTEIGYYWMLNRPTSRFGMSCVGGGSSWCLGVIPRVDSLVTMVFFWACEVSETKATAVEVPEGFVLNVCNATTGSFPADAAVSLGVETLQMDKKPWKGVVAHLGKPVGAWQAKLDLVFSQKVKFYLAKGSGKVHVSGYFQPGPPADMFEDDIQLVVGEPAAASADADAGKKSKKRAREDSKTLVSWDQVRLPLRDSVCTAYVRVDLPICKLPPRASLVLRGSRPFGIGKSSLHGESSSRLYTHAWSLRLSPRGGRRSSGCLVAGCEGQESSLFCLEGLCLSSTLSCASIAPVKGTLWSFQSESYES